MADECDMAQEAQERHMRALLAQAGTRPGPAQVREDGVAICRECGDPIDARRLAALPDAAFCVECQAIHDGEAA